MQTSQKTVNMRSELIAVAVRDHSVLAEPARSPVSMKGPFKFPNS